MIRFHQSFAIKEANFQCHRQFLCVVEEVKMGKFSSVFVVVVMVCLAQAFPTNEVEDPKKIIIRENTPENSKSFDSLTKFSLNSNQFLNLSSRTLE
jgi:hypothetical protein